VPKGSLQKKSTTVEQKGKTLTLGSKLAGAEAGGVDGDDVVDE
jgi:hypothetical protein